MIGPSSNWEESMGSQRQDHFLNLERRKDREVSVHTTHTSRSHISYEKNTRTMQLEIDHLRRRLCREQQRQTPSNSDFSSDNDRDGSYRPRLRTPFSESFSVMRIATMSADIRARLAKAWEMTL